MALMTSTDVVPIANGPTTGTMREHLVGALTLIRYAAQRERVRNMRFRAVEIEHSLVQTMLETYAILALDTTHYTTFHTTWDALGGGVARPSLHSRAVGEHLGDTVSQEDW